MQLSWRYADHGTRRDLQAFTCAYPAKASTYRRQAPRHARPWQVEVQSSIRDLRTPINGQKVLTAYDEEVLAGVSVFSHALDGDSPPAHFIHLIARANAYYGSDVADQVLGATILALQTYNVENTTDYGVYCKVHINNRSSRRLMVRHGFEKFGNEYPLDWWGRDL